MTRTRYKLDQTLCLGLTSGYMRKNILLGQMHHLRIDLLVVHILPTSGQTLLKMDLTMHSTEFFPHIDDSPLFSGTGLPSRHISL